MYRTITDKNHKRKGRQDEPLERVKTPQNIRKNTKHVNNNFIFSEKKCFLLKKKGK